MMRRSKANAQILDEAATWYVDFSEGEVDEAGRREFSCWLKSSPEHVRAYLQVAALWEDASLLGGKRRPDAEALIAEALREEDVIPLRDVRAGKETDARASKSTAVAHRPDRRRVLQWGLAAASISALAGGVLLVGLSHYRTYATGVGEQRTIALPDGSVIELNARSQVRVELTPAMRLVALMEGQALFHVAKDATRAFVVQSGSTRVFAIGTQFDVLRKGTNVTVTVVEGTVAVTNAESARASVHAPPARLARLIARRQGGGQAAATAPAADAVFLSAGEQVTMYPQGLPQPVRVDVTVAMAWTQHRLVFNDSPLSEVADEYNRYNRRPLVIRDRAVRSFHVSGEFSSADGASLIEFLRAQPDLRVRETGSAIEISGAR